MTPCDLRSKHTVSRYDFAVYGLLAPEIGQAFFPDASPELQLINSFGVYFGAFLMRPLGAIAFGEIGDRMVGRKNALAFSLILITVPSILMGMLPTYEVWGTAAPILLVILRMMQGLSVGGQLAGSYVISIEQSSASSRGFRGSVCDASSSGGFLLASLVVTVTRSLLSEEQVDEWGWRCPFLFSLLLAPILYRVVRNADESKHWTNKTEEKDEQDMIRENESKDMPAIVDLLSSPFRRRQLGAMIGMLSATSSTFYVLFLWTPVYLSHLRGIVPESIAGMINLIVVSSYIVFLLISGKASDQFPHRMDLMRIGLPGIIIGCPAMFGMFESESYVGYLSAQLLLAACLAMLQGSTAAWKVEMWMADPTLSYTAVAIGHNASAMLFGGTIPLVATFLYYREEALIGDDEDPFWPRLLPGLYVSLLGCLSLYCISYVARHPHDVRTGDAKLRQLVARENQKYKRARKDRKKRRAQLDQQLSTDGAYSPPTLT